jgi:pimeloyl-ACP methyl ester carboxylesterase
MQFAKSIDNLSLVSKYRAFRNMRLAPDVYFADFERYLIRYQLKGNGERVLVFIPNAPNMIEHYAYLVSLLEKDFRILIFELPGFGYSIPKTLDYDYSLTTCTQVATDLLDYLGVQNSILAFPCLGGFIALKIAEQRPDLVFSLVMMQTVCWEEQQKWGWQIHRFLPLGTPIKGQLLIMLMKKKITRNWYRRTIEDRTKQTEFTRIALQQYAKGAAYTIASSFQGLFNSPAPQFRFTTKPAIVLWGAADVTHRKSDQWSILQYCANAAPYEFHGSGHFPELEYPELFADILRSEYEVVTEKIA